MNSATISMFAAVALLGVSIAKADFRVKNAILDEERLKNCVVLAGQIEGVEPRDVWGLDDNKKFDFAVATVLQGDARIQNRVIRVDARVLLWPERLVPCQPGTNCIL